ncbi:MAG: ABC transporter permease, partial [Phycisphaeraceae bacterium]|nr:ABC transporter permease [Phycisphaeraceae bacterium]
TVEKALQEPTEYAPVLFNRIDRDPREASPDFYLKLHEQWQVEPEAARKRLLDAVVFETTSLNRVRLDHPTFKMPDLGTTLRNRRVIDRLAESLPITLLLNALTLPLIYVGAIWLGIRMAGNRGQLSDVGTGTVLLGLWSLPVIWVGVMAINYLANEDYLRLFPAAGLHSLTADRMPFMPHWTEAGFERGWLLDTLWHLVLPVVCLSYGSLAVLAKLTRSSMLENLGADFVRTARAKGVDESAILYQHAFRNSLLPLITVVASILPAMIGGSVVIENLFSLPGMGKLGVEAAFQRDRELVLGTTLVAGLLGLSAELLRDLCYAIADPRVSYD